MLVIGLLLLSHLTWSARRKRAFMFISLLMPAVTLYWLVRKLVPLPGNETQFDILAYPMRLLQLPTLLLSLRGILLNLYPLWPIALAILFFFRMASGKRRQIVPSFHWSHILVPIGLILLGAALEVYYNIGRIAFLSFPFFLSVLGWNGTYGVRKFFAHER